MAFISSKRRRARSINVLVLLRIVAAAEAAVGQQRLSEFGRTLDCVKDLKAAPECGVGLGPFTHRFVNLAQDTMGRDFLETEGASLCSGKRLANDAQGFAEVTRGQMDLSAGDLRVRDCVRLQVADARWRFSER